MLLTKDNIIFIDVDDTLCDTRGAVAQLYREFFGERPLSLSVKSKRYGDFCPKWSDEDIENLFKGNSRLYDIAVPIEGAIDAVKRLERIGYDLRIVTFNHALGISKKQEWIDKFFPTLSNKIYYLTMGLYNKDVFEGYAIIDDDMKNILSNKSTHRILLDVYNIYSVGEKSSNWNDVLSKIISFGGN